MFLMNIVEKFKAKTPRKNKLKGRVLTFLGVFSSILLSMDDFQNKYITALLIAVATFSGVGAAYHGQKVLK